MEIYCKEVTDIFGTFKVLSNGTEPDELAKRILGLLRVDMELVEIYKSLSIEKRAALYDFAVGLQAEMNPQRTMEQKLPERWNGL